jgi:hypothetical protein
MGTSCMEIWYNSTQMYCKMYCARVKYCVWGGGGLIFFELCHSPHRKNIERKRTELHRDSSTSFYCKSERSSIDHLQLKGIDQWEKRWVKSGIAGSRCQLFSLRFSNRSVQAPSCERPKTTQRILFLSFEIKNSFQILRWCKKISKIQITLTILHPTLGNNNCLQIIETGFAEQFWASHRMRTEQICLKFPRGQLKARSFSLAKTLKSDIRNIIITKRISLLRVYVLYIKRTKVSIVNYLDRPRFGGPARGGWRIAARGHTFVHPLPWMEKSAQQR